MITWCNLRSAVHYISWKAIITKYAYVLTIAIWHYIIYIKMYMNNDGTGSLRDYGN